MNISIIFLSYSCNITIIIIIIIFWIIIIVSSSNSMDISIISRILGIVL